MGASRVRFGCSPCSKQSLRSRWLAAVLHSNVGAHCERGKGRWSRRRGAASIQVKHSAAFSGHRDSSDWMFSSSPRTCAGVGTSADAHSGRRRSSTQPTFPGRTRMSELRTLLLTDVVNSTGLAEALGDSGTATLWMAHDRLARDLLPAWRGREIDKTDGMLLLFEATA